MSIIDRYICANQFYNRGVNAIETHDFHGALQDLNRALHINPRYTLAFINRGQLYQQHHQNRHAAADYESALRLDPHDAQTRYRLAVLYEQNGALSKSARHFRGVLVDAGWQNQPAARAALENLHQRNYRVAVQKLHRLLSRLDFH